MWICVEMYMMMLLLLVMLVHMILIDDDFLAYSFEIMNFICWVDLS